MSNPEAVDYRRFMLGVGRWVAAQGLVALSTVVALWIASRWGKAAVEMVYLPAVLAAAAWWGFGPAVLAAVTSALAYNFFFLPPLYTFRITSAVDILNMTILFFVAVVTSQLASAIRRQARIAEAHATRNATIAGFARRLLSGTTEEEIAQAACGEMSGILNCNTILMAGLPRPKTVAAAPKGPAITPTDIAAAVQTLESGRVAGHGASSVGPAEWMFHPIRTDGAPIAAMGFSRDDGFNPISDDQLLLVESLLDQTALALARTYLPETTPRKAAGMR